MKTLPTYCPKFWLNRPGKHVSYRGIRRKRGRSPPRESQETAGHLERCLRRSPLVLTSAWAAAGGWPCPSWSGAPPRPFHSTWAHDLIGFSTPSCADRFGPVSSSLICGSLHNLHAWQNAWSVDFSLNLCWTLSSSTLNQTLDQSYCFLLHSLLHTNNLQPTLQIVGEKAICVEKVVCFWNTCVFREDLKSTQILRGTY